MRQDQLVIGKEYTIKGIGGTSNLYTHRRAFEGRRCRLLGFFDGNQLAGGDYPGVYVEMDITDEELPLSSTVVRINTKRLTQDYHRIPWGDKKLGTPGWLVVQCCAMCLEDCEEDLEYDKYDQE